MPLRARHFDVKPCLSEWIIFVGKTVWELISVTIWDGIRQSKNYGTMRLFLWRLYWL